MNEPPDKLLDEPLDEPPDEPPGINPVLYFDTNPSVDFLFNLSVNLGIGLGNSVYLGTNLGDDFGIGENIGTDLGNSLDIVSASKFDVDHGISVGFEKEEHLVNLENKSLLASSKIWHKYSPYMLNKSQVLVEKNI